MLKRIEHLEEFLADDSDDIVTIKTDIKAIVERHDSHVHNVCGVDNGTSSYPIVRKRNE